MQTASAAAAESPSRRLHAYRIHEISNGTFPSLVPAPADRDWMDNETGGWANRCLPLRIANQAGWWLLNDAEFEVRWNGRRALDAIEFRNKTDKPFYVRSMFGHGIITWVIPYLIRTEPGYNLLVKGPANLWKDGMAPLEGLVETDWMAATFTMNWKITRAGHWVHFAKDEPIALLLPMRRYELESFQPEMRNLESESALLDKFRVWYQSRRQKVQDAQGLAMEEKKIEGHYIRGQHVDGERAQEHQNKIAVRPFLEMEKALHGQAAQSSSPTPARRGWLGRLMGN